MKNFSLTATLALAPILSLALVSQTAHAQNQSQSQNQNQDQNQNQNQDQNQNQAGASQAYRLSKSMTLHPEVILNAPEKNGSAIEIPADSLFTILENAVDANGQSMVHVGLDSDSNVPSDFWVRSSEVDRSMLVEVGDDFDLQGSGTKRMTYCYKFVKMYLMKIGLVRGYLAGGSAWMAKSALPAAGFHMTGRRPAQAQINDVCVYYGGRGGNGHIEVRTSGGWYYGYGYKSAPITLVNHSLIGCYAK